MNGSGTRSSLMYETLRIVNKLKPKYVIWENVKNLLSKKHKHNFDNYLDKMSELGYKNYYQVLDAKDYGIPQHRERVFTVSIRNDIEKEFIFPEKEELKLRLKDMLGDKVDEKYYLSEKMMNYIVANNEKWAGNNDKSLVNKPIASTINTGEGSRRCDASNYVAEPYEKTIDIKQVGQIYGTEREPNPQAGRVYDSEGISPTMDSCSGGNRMPKILIKNATKKEYQEAYDGNSVNLQQPNSTTRRARVGEQIANTLQTSDSMAVVELKRGYQVKVKVEETDTDQIDILGNYSKSNYCGTPIINKNGIAPTVRENHGQVSAVSETFKTNNKRIIKLANSIKKEDKQTLFMDIYNQKNIENEAGTLKSGMDHQQGNIIYTDLRIRKLTPKECWRLMGFTDEEFEKAEKVNSNSQLYKQAGNSIVVNVLEKILENLLIGDTNDNQNTASMQK